MKLKIVFDSGISSRLRADTDGMSDTITSPFTAAPRIDTGIQLHRTIDGFDHRTDTRAATGGQDPETARGDLLMKMADSWKRARKLSAQSS